jgi:hypothetical protein
VECFDAVVESSLVGFRLSALVGLLGSAFPLSISKTQALLDQLLGGDPDDRRRWLWVLIRSPQWITP